jgi:5S rRNA maturation endonuclease (ribonuclease M5)
MNKHYNQALVNQVTDECCEVIEDMLSDLHVDYTRSSRRLFGPCPIHGGDNPGAWSLYPEGEAVRGIWFCRTHNCHETWKKTLVGFVHGLLSSRATESLPWTAAVDWMLVFLGYRQPSDVKLPDAATLERRQFNNMARRLNLSPNVNTEHTWAPAQYQSAVQIPSPYYLNRKYKESTLKHYDIGYAQRTNRSVVPIYDLGHKTIVGMTARTHWDQCLTCGYYHDSSQPCPTRIADQINACKWKNSPGFEAAHYLYNLWFARQHIIDTSTIILVEGPGDVWRLEESGIHNSVAIFGTDLSEEQLVLLEGSWAMNVVVLTDNDEAGRKAAQLIKSKLQRTHRLYFPTLVTEDVGALQTDQVTDDIEPIINQIINFNKLLGIQGESND